MAAASRRTIVRRKSILFWEDLAFDSESDPNAGETLDISEYTQMSYQVAVVSGGATRTILWQLSNDGTTWTTDATVAAGGGSSGPVDGSANARYGRVSLGVEEAATSIDSIWLMFK